VLLALWYPEEAHFKENWFDLVALAVSVPLASTLAAYVGFRYGIELCSTTIFYQGVCDSRRCMPSPGNGLNMGRHIVRASSGALWDVS
jgi:hypothetical protein